MKESELMKEVVRRSVEPDLEDASMRIIEDHEFTSDHPTATVTTSYLTRIVAAFAIVFTLGLVAGLIIMKSVLRKDPPVNTAPDIVDTRSGASEDPVDSSSLVDSLVSSSDQSFDPSEYNPFLNYNGQVLYSHNNVGTVRVFSNMISSPVTVGVINYLSTCKFIGFIGSQGTYLWSNIAPVGSAVFLSSNNESYYTVSPDNKYYVFGRAEVPDFSNDSPREIFVSKNSNSTSKTSVFYKDKVHHVLATSMRTYTTQDSMFSALEIRDVLKNAYFLGLTSPSSECMLPVINNIDVPYGAAVFYNDARNSFILFFVQDSKYVMRELVITETERFP